ncbi:hypothetical protein Tco_1379333 [Tanacetum coccineum]
MDDPNITMEEYIRLEEEKAQKRGKVFNWETAKYALSCKPRVSSLNNEIDFRISFDDSDDEDYTLNTAYPLPSDTAMTKVIKGEFEKINNVKVEDVSLTCDTLLEVFNNEVSRLSGMDDDLFIYEVEVANIPCNSNMDGDSEHEADDDMGYDPFDVAFTEWFGSKIFNYKTMDHYTMKALWIYWIRGDDEVELTDEESFDDMDEVAKVFRIDTNLFNFKTPMCKAFKEFSYLLQVYPDLLTKDIEGFKTYEDYKNDWIYEWNKDVPWVDEKPWTNIGHTMGLSTIRLGVWNGQYVVGRMMDTVMEETYPELTLLETNSITKALNGMKLWKIANLKMRLLETKLSWKDLSKKTMINNEREELYEVHELPVCKVRRYMMIKYSFNNDEEDVAVKEDEYYDLTITRKEACRAYQEIFRIMNEG